MRRPSKTPVASTPPPARSPCRYFHPVLTDGVLLQELDEIGAEAAELLREAAVLQGKHAPLRAAQTERNRVHHGIYAVKFLMPILMPISHKTARNRPDFPKNRLTIDASESKNNSPENPIKSRDFGGALSRAWRDSNPRSFESESNTLSTELQAHP